MGIPRQAKPYPLGIKKALAGGKSFFYANNYTFISFLQQPKSLFHWPPYRQQWLGH